MPSVITPSNGHSSLDNNPEKIRGENSIKMVNIVVAVDESEESMRACEWACKHLLASQADIQQSSNFILLHVQPTPCISTGPAYIPSRQVFELLELQTKRSTQRILKRALNICDRYGVKAETHVVTGEAKERICEAAAKLGAHFLVVGSHGHGTFIRAMRGSVSDYCARNAVCPVVPWIERSDSIPCLWISSMLEGSILCFWNVYGLV